MKPVPIRNTPYHLSLKSYGKDVCIAPDVWIEHPELIELGDNVTIHRGVSIIGQPVQANFGSHVTLGPYSQLLLDEGRIVMANHVRFYTGTYLEAGRLPTSFIEIGSHTHFAPYAILYGGGGLKIGSGCNISAHTVFATVGHDHKNTVLPLAQSRHRAPITLEDDVWVAANSTICAGVTIATGCVVAANAVLTESTQPMGIYAGVPARRVKDRIASLQP